MKTLIAIFLVVTLNVAFGISVSVAYSQNELETFDNEPPLIRSLLERASVLMANENDADATWKAANLYCEAARYGSAEGVYRLGCCTHLDVVCLKILIMRLIYSVSPRHTVILKPKKCLRLLRLKLQIHHFAC